MKTILIVEDDLILCEGLCRALTSEQWHTVGANTLEEARTKMRNLPPDCMILDCNLPDGSGFDFCREILRLRFLPVLFLTVRDSEADEVAGLQAGACDYMKKPFSLMVLRERVGKMLRFAETEAGDGGLRYEADHYRFRFDTLEFSAYGQTVFLSASEARLLSVLVKNAGRVVNRGALIDALWDCGEDGVSENTLSVTVKRLRDKLGGGAIRTVYGLGYVWKGDEA